MSVRKTDDFIADVTQQFDWYVENGGSEVAARYLDAVESTCCLLARYPNIGPVAGFKHPRLHKWRFFTIMRPFNKYILFFEVLGDDVILRRAMHGSRDLSARLLEPPWAG